MTFVIRRPGRTKVLRGGSRLIVLLLFAAVPLLLVGCGGSSTSTSVHRTITPTTAAEKATFTTHAGLAFGIFHRYVYNALKTDALSNPAQRKHVLARTSAAARVAADEVALARQNAAQGTALRKLLGPVAALQPTLRGVATALERGHPDVAGIRAANAAIANIEASGSVGGVKIVEHTPAASPSRSRRG